LTTDPYKRNLLESTTIRKRSGKVTLLGKELEDIPNVLDYGISTER
jgi:hypothetical protein